MQLIDVIVLVSYFTTMVAIGVWAMRRVKGQEDYFMGGRGFGRLMQTFAAFGAGTGAHGVDKRAERGLVSPDVVVRDPGVLDRCGLVSPDAAHHAG
jgi:hypothetical protein